MQVDYDRNAAKRTSVIDDQSDFFEIDSNAWLSDEVRPCCHAREHPQAAFPAVLCLSNQSSPRQIAITARPGPSLSGARLRKT